MATGDVYRLAIRSTYTGTDDIVNVFHFRQTADDGAQPNKALACINAFGVTALTDYLNCIPNSISLSLYSCRGVLGSIEEAELSVTVNGTSGAGDVLPLQSAPIISWRTGASGRRRRGRTYMPPILEGQQTGGLMALGIITALEDFAAVVLTIATSDPTPDEFELVVFSPENLSAVPPRAGDLITPITAYIVRDVVGSQRRRRQGTGS